MTHTQRKVVHHARYIPIFFFHIYWKTSNSVSTLFYKNKEHNFQLFYMLTKYREKSRLNFEYYWGRMNKYDILCPQGIITMIQKRLENNQEVILFIATLQLLTISTNLSRFYH